MNSSEIINAFCDNVLRDSPSSKVFPNVYVKGFEADILEFKKSGYATEYEVKVSRADFKNDAKKSRGLFAKENKHETIKDGCRVNRFYYVVPADLIAVDDLSAFAGLIYARWRHDGKQMFFMEIKSATLLRKEKLPDVILQKCLESTYYRFHKLRHQRAMQVRQQARLLAK